MLIGFINLRKNRHTHIIKWLQYINRDIYIYIYLPKTMATCVTTVNRMSLFLFCFGLLHWNTYAIYIYTYNHMIIWAQMHACAWTKCKHVTFKLNPAARFHWLYSSIINHNLFPTSPGVFSYLTIIPSSHAQIHTQKQLTCSAFFGKVPVYGKKWRTKSDQTTRISTTTMFGSKIARKK